MSKYPFPKREQAKLDYLKEDILGVEKAVERFNPTQIKLRKSSTYRGKKTMIFVLSDMHLGAYADEDELFQGKNTNESVQREQMDELLSKSLQSIKEQKPEKVIILLLGDILHGVEGKTVKGTQLECSTIRDKQFDLGLEVLTTYISKLYTVSHKMEVRSVRGNHDGTTNYMLMRAVQSFFRKSNIKFIIPNSITDIFKERGALICYEHGESPDYKHSGCPASKNKKELYINNMFLGSSRDFPGFSGKRYYIQGHKHRTEILQMEHFQYILAPAMVTGDRYANHHGYNCHPCQLVLTVTEEGVTNMGFLQL